MVLLPEPVSPTIAVVVPRTRSNETSSTAWTTPFTFEKTRERKFTDSDSTERAI